MGRAEQNRKRRRKKGPVAGAPTWPGHHPCTRYRRASRAATAWSMEARDAALVRASTNRGLSASSRQNMVRWPTEAYGGTWLATGAASRSCWRQQLRVAWRGDMHNRSVGSRGTSLTGRERRRRQQILQATTGCSRKDKECWRRGRGTSPGSCRLGTDSRLAASGRGRGRC